MRVKRVLAAAVAVAIAPAVARAEPDLGDGPSEREWPRWEIGVRSPVELAAIRDGGKEAWTIATGAAHAGLVLGRLVVLVEGEIDAVMVGDSTMGNLQRVGVDVRFHWWRAIGRWRGTAAPGSSRAARSTPSSRSAPASSGSRCPARRRSRAAISAIGVGIEPGMWLTKQR